MATEGSVGRVARTSVTVTGLSEAAREHASEDINEGGGGGQREVVREDGKDGGFVCAWFVSEDC